MVLIVGLILAVAVGIIIDYSSSNYRGAEYFRNIHWSNSRKPSVISRIRSLRRDQGE